MKTITFQVPDDYTFASVVDGVAYPVPVESMTNDALVDTFAYGLQRKINDKTGGKDKTAEDKRKLALDMIARLTAAVYIRRRVGRGPTDPIVRFIRDVLRGLLAHPSYKTQATEYKALDGAEARNEWLDDWFAEMPEATAEKIRGLAQSALDKWTEERNAVNALAGDLALSVPSAPAEKATKKKK